jgi:hypothetical protein
MEPQEGAQFFLLKSEPHHNGSLSKGTFLRKNICEIIVLKTNA